MLIPILMTIPALLTAPGPRPGSVVNPHTIAVEDIMVREHAALVAFDRAISKYVELHRQLARTSPPLQITANPVQLRGAVEALAEAIRLARPAAQPGDVFTPVVARMFQRRINRALWTFDVPALVSEMEDDTEPCAVPPVVNGPFPWNSGNAIWPSVLAALPPLPEELEYRFVGADLVLIDVPANLVVDVLEDVLPVSEGS